MANLNSVEQGQFSRLIAAIEHEDLASTWADLREMGNYNASTALIETFQLHEQTVRLLLTKNREGFLDAVNQCRSEKRGALFAMIAIAENKL